MGRGTGMTDRSDMRWLLEESDLSAERIDPHEWMIRYVDSDGQWNGIIELHEKPDGTICGGSVLFSMPYGSPAVPRSEGVTPQWHVDSTTPLTISPSVLCSPELGGCGHHGYIRSGQWVTA